MVLCVGKTISVYVCVYIPVCDVFIRYALQQMEVIKNTHIPRFLGSPACSVF